MGSSLSTDALNFSFEFNDLIVKNQTDMNDPMLNLDFLNFNKLTDSDESSMQLDPNYSLVIESFTENQRFGDNRNTAITIVGNFMRENKIFGNPQIFTDVELFNILTKTTTLVASLLIRNIQFKASMKSDSNYNNIISNYSKTFGFKANRNTAIVIVGNFMRLNNLDMNPQSFSDTKLYNIITAECNNSAIQQINVCDKEYLNKPAYIETWVL